MWLVREHVEVDVEQFLREAGEGRRLLADGATAKGAAVLGLAAARYVGDFCADDPYADWAGRDAGAGPPHVRRDGRPSSGRIADERGDHGDAVRLRLRILDVDPYDEAAHLDLVRALSAQRRHGEARRAYRTYCERLAELDLDPASFPGRPPPEHFLNTLRTSSGSMARWRSARRWVHPEAGRAAWRVDPYPLPVRPISPSSCALPLVDLRSTAPAYPPSPVEPWLHAVAYVRQLAAGRRRRGTAGRRHQGLRPRPWRRRRPAGAGAAVLDAGDAVALDGWWPTEAMATTTEILGVDAIEVPPPDRKRAGLVDGHSVVLVGYGRHAAFPGGGYFIVRNSWSGWGDGGDGYLPFTFARAYATELRAYRRPGARRGSGGGEAGEAGEAGEVGEPAGAAASADRPVAGIAPAAGGRVGHGSRTPLDVEIDRLARCADPRAALTHLFFSEDRLELARARAICTTCDVRRACLTRAIERHEPYGVWGAELLVDGLVVADKRGRGRPPKRPPPRLVVDEITGRPSSPDGGGT